MHVLLLAVECTGLKDCSEKLNYIPVKTMDKQLRCFAHPWQAIHCPGFNSSRDFDPDKKKQTWSHLKYKGL